MTSWEMADEELRNLACDQKLRILVWGPGDPGPEASPKLRRRYEKRVQIRDELASVFTKSEICFSEDPALQKMTQYVRGQLRKEAVHAAHAHVVLMLDVGRGVDLELDYFVKTYPWFRDKVYVFIPEEFVNTKGLVSDVFDDLRPDQVEGFSEDDLRTCRVATESAVNIVKSVAMMLFLKRLGAP